MTPLLAEPVAIEAAQRWASGARVERSEAKRNEAERESPARPCCAAA
jgi:hypothetical protein